ncbi:MAG: hypothetical protein NZO16_06925 [Deltaproteobacteria bacterium]|nr:hypothetical protein [Deltaproteobacteria bacterium]
MKLFVSCGETSGDKILSKVLLELRNFEPNIQFFGLGGRFCQKAGVNMILETNSDNFGQFGLLGLKTLFQHYRLLQNSVKWLERNRPTGVILCDYAEFNYNLAKRAYRLGLPVYWISPPQVWAWRSYRLQKLKKILAGGALVLPFEENLWNDINRFRFWGNPLGYLASFYKYTPEEKKIAFFPGSRLGELKKISPILNSLAHKLVRNDPELKMVVANVFNEDLLFEYLDPDLFRVENDSLNLLSTSRFAILKSGSSTIEATVIGVPFIVIYKVSKLTELVARAVLNIRNVALPNILSEKTVREFLQDECNSEKIYSYLLGAEFDKLSIQAKLQDVKSRLLLPCCNPFTEIARHILKVFDVS